MAAKTKLFKLVATWLAEVRRESDPAATLAQYGGVAPVALTFDDVREAAVDAAMVRQGYDVLGAPVPVDNLVYVDAAAGLDTNPGTQALPVQTIERALELLARGWTRYGVMFLSAATYTIAANSNLEFPRGVGANAWPLQILGTWIDSGQGTLAASAVTPGTANPPVSTAITTTGGTSGAWVANQWRGYFLRRTVIAAGGTPTGQRSLISDNTANVLSGTYTAPVALNDSFVLEKPGTILSFGASCGILTQTDVVLRGCETRFAASAALTINGSVRFESGWVSNGGAGSFTWSVFNFGRLVTGSNALPTLPLKSDFSDATQQYTRSDSGGVYWATAGLVAVSSGGMFQSTLSVFDGVASSIGGVLNSIRDKHMGNASVRFTFSSGSNINNTRFDAVTPLSTAGAAVVVENGSQAALSSLVVANTPATTAPGDAILVRAGSFANLTNVTGAGNAGVGVRCLKQSRAAATAPNTGVTVTGTGGDTQIGGNAAATTWANVLAGAAANTTDLAAAIPQICSVSAP